ncbi:DUF1761 domain-containing protein [Leptospira sp. 201903071]|uniref:DUF1761 domain-containing protein n=1 Tax=Leptospira ainazelensis TaxID=2810034 RepID=UPI0019664A4D|nr:DUF1761 domain-containing protein [Leptospira ainazelensis]MBM9500260.1 DUF1761 domain-containing protein [Leptospira ainazelensis]
MKKFTYAVLGYLIPTFLLGASWHFIFFSELYDSFGIYSRKDPIIPLGFGSMLIQGIVLAYLFPFYNTKGNSIVRGIQFGLIMGVFLYSVSTIANAAKMEIHSVGIWFLVQAVFHLIQFTVAGFFIGFAYKNQNG